MPFSDFSLSSAIQHKVKLKGFTEPTSIQQKVIPLVLDKKDVMAKAQTGSGKSASFVLPVVELLSRHRLENLLLRWPRPLSSLLQNV